MKKLLTAILLAAPLSGWAATLTQSPAPVNGVVITPSSITVSGMASGSVWFSTTSGNLWQNSNFFFDHTNTSLGVGNAAPAYPLDVTGALRATGQGIFGGTVTVSGNAFSVGTSTLTAVAGNVGVGTTNPRTLLEVGTGKLNIMSAGNVGIGNTNPLDALTVGAEQTIAGGGFAGAASVNSGSNAVTLITENSSTDSNNIRINNTSAGGKQWMLLDAGSANGIASVGTFILRNQSDAVNAVSVLSGGNVGIGTVAPTTKLHVSSGTLLVDGNVQFKIELAGSSPILQIDDGNTAKFYMGVNSGASSLTSDSAVATSADDVIFRSIDSTNGALRFVTQNGAKVAMSVMRSGNIGIGNTPSSLLHMSSGTLTIDGNVEQATSLGGGNGLYSRTVAQLQVLAPTVAGEQYYCSNCSPKKVVISTGTSAGNFADAAGGAFQ